MTIKALGRQDLNQLPKALQQWLIEATRRLAAQEVVAALPFTLAPTGLPDAPAAAVAYTQADIQALVDLVNALKDNQGQIIALLGSIVEALGQPIGG